MVRDDNKGISSISYNHLHLPVKIVMAGGNIEYLYDAAGVKLKKTVTEPGRPVMMQDYLSGFIYSNGVLELFPTAEGYVKNTAVSGADRFNYVYNYTDHLGNVRVSYGQDPVTQAVKILEENNYYPFGLKHKNYNMSQKNYIKTNGGVSLDPICVNCAVPFKYNYKFQGQERQDELGLNWDSFKWRNYDYAIGRFFNVDPLAPDFPQWSPYVFSGNLVTISKELEGMEPDFLIGSDGKLSSGAITLMNAAYGYSVSSLTNSTWIVNSDARMKSWDRLTGHPAASVKGNDIMYSSTVSNNTNEYWVGLIAHEQSHRSDIENGISRVSRNGFSSFYLKYLLQGAKDGYRGIETEKKAYRNGSDDDNQNDFADQLVAYKSGAVMEIFQRGNLTNNEKANLLETVGNQFRRDVVIQGEINTAQSALKNIGSMNWSSETTSSVSTFLNSFINGKKKEQEEITKKYGN